MQYRFGHHKDIFSTDPLQFGQGGECQKFTDFGLVEFGTESLNQLSVLLLTDVEDILTFTNLFRVHVHSAH